MKKLNTLLLAIPLFILFSCSAPAPQKELADTDYLAFADSVSKAMEKRDVKFVNERWDMDEFIFRSISDVDVNVLQKKGAASGIRKEIDVLVEKICEQIGTNGRFPFLKMKKNKGEVRLLFALHSENGLNYYDMVMSNKNGRPYICDMYIFLSGEEFSKTLSGLLVSSIKETGDKDLISVVMGSKKFDEEKSKHIQTMQEALELSKNGEPERARKMYEALPDDVRKQKFYALMNVMICMNDSAEVYIDAIESYKRQFPDDPSVDLISLDGYALQGKYADVLKAVNNLDKQVNDPYLDLYRAVASFQMGNNQGAAGYYRKMTKSYPGMYKDNYYNASSFYALAGENDSAIVMLQQYVKDVKIPAKEVAADFGIWASAVPQLVPFFKSVPYRNFAAGK